MRSRSFPLLLTVLCAFVLSASGQSALAQPAPPNLEPLPEAAPPPPEIANDPELEPQVTIIRRETETVEEYRVNGRLTMIKVTPKTGRPYYLLPSNGVDGPFIRRDSLDNGLKVPLWLLFSF